jgi:ESCRT-I complex subunit VPS37
MTGSRSSENNLALQDNLYALRTEAKQAFDEAKALEARWKELEREQREIYQVCRLKHPVLTLQS